MISNDKNDINAQYHIWAFIFNKNEGDNQKVEKVSGRVRVGVGRAYIVPIRWHPLNHLK